MVSLVNAVNYNQHDEFPDDDISDNEISGFANTTKFPPPVRTAGETMVVFTFI